jgi:integrase
MKTRKGWLIVRGRTYHAAWKINGKLFTKSTGQTDHKDAVKELARIMQPFLVEDTVTTLQNIKATIEAGKDQLAILDEERNPPLSLDRAWKAFDASPSRPDSGERTLAGYKAEFERFKRWMTKEHPGADKDCPDRITMRDIGADVAGEYAQDLTAAKVSASTFNQHVKLLSLVWRKLAPEIKGGGVNPWSEISRRRLNPLANRKRALTPAQFDELLAQAVSDPEAHDLFVMLAWTGLRLVDAVKMTWGMVDFSRRVITLAPQKTMRRTGKTVSIPMFPAVKDVLDRRQEGKALNPARYVFPELVAEYDRDSGSTLSKRITAIFEKAGMPTSEARAGQARAVVCYGAHSLRHHFVSAASSVGMPSAMIKSITGHATDSMLEHYQHIGTDLAAEFGKRLGEGGTKALPPAQSPRLIDAGMVSERLQAMTAKTWKTIRDELLTMVSKQ